MAVTSLWRVKGNIGKLVMYTMNSDKTTVPEIYEDENTSDVLSGIVSYVERDSATNLNSLVDGIECHKETVATDMMTVKNKFKKTGGVIAYHGYQSFAEGEVTPDIAHEIGKKLARRLWGEKYQVLITTHVDKDSHIHNHFVINTVSFVNGEKFHRTKKDYYQMREESDRLCKEYGLSVIEKTGNRKLNYAEWLAQKENRPTVREQIRYAIDVALDASTDKKHFFDAMDEMGFVIDISGKHPKIKHNGSSKFVRFDSLGEGYSFDEIIEYIIGNDEPIFPELPEQEPPKQIFAGERGRVQSFDYIAIYRAYYKAITVTKERPKTNRRMFFLVCQDHNKMKTYSDAVVLVSEHNLKNEEDVLKYRSEAKEKIKETERLRYGLKIDMKRNNRHGNNDEVAKIKYNIDIYTRQLNKLRREVKSCDYVVARADEVRSKLIRIENEKFRGKEGVNSEHFSRSGRPDREDVADRN